MLKKPILIVILIISGIFIYSQTVSVLSTKGTVQVKRNANAGWVDAFSGQKLEKGYFIFTGFKSSSILSVNNAKVEVKPLTQLTIEEVISNKSNYVSDIYIKYGKVKVEVTKTENVKTVFKVRSANTTASVRGTTFTFGDNYIYVENGTVILENDNFESILVQKNEEAYNPVFGVIRDPYYERTKDSYVNIRPAGASESELDNAGSDRGGSLSNSKNAEIIISIKVIN